jgi:hypothetical protein
MHRATGMAGSTIRRGIATGLGTTRVVPFWCVLGVARLVACGSEGCGALRGGALVGWSAGGWMTTCSPSSQAQ